MHTNLCCAVAALVTLTAAGSARAQTALQPITFGAVDTVFVRDAEGAALAAGAASVTDLLTSQAPWLLVTRPSGAVGEAATLSLRDIGPGLPPVVVYVDGVRLDALPLPILVRRRTVDPLLEIDPEQVERIELARGPVAAARWGSDAAGGVLLITTHRPASDGGLRQSVSATLGAVTPGPSLEPVWWTCTGEAPLAECDGRAPGEVVTIDALAQSGLVKARMLHGLRWSADYRRGPLSAGVGLASEDRPGAFPGEGFGRRTGSLVLGWIPHSTVRLDVWGTLVDADPDVQGLATEVIRFPHDGALRAASDSSGSGAYDRDARRFGATITHAPFSWFQHSVAATGHDVQEMAILRYAEDRTHGQEIGRWQGAWEYEVRARVPSGARPDWSFGAEASVRGERADRHVIRGGPWPPDEGAVGSLEGRWSRGAGFRARTAFEVAWQNRARLVAGLASEDGDDMAERLTPSDGALDRVLPSVALEYAWPRARFWAAWGRARVSRSYDAFFTEALSPSAPAPYGEYGTTEAGAVATLAGGRLRAGLTISRTDASTEHEFAFPLPHLEQVDTRTDAAEATLEGTLLRAAGLIWDAGAAVMVVRAEVVDVRFPFVMGGSPGLLGMAEGAWPASYVRASVLRVDTVAGVVVVVGDGPRFAGHLAPTLEAALRTTVTAGRVRLDATVQVREGNTVVNRLAFGRDYAGLSRAANDPSFPEDERLIRFGPFVTENGAQVNDYGAYLEDGSFVRLRHLGLTIGLPARIAGLGMPAGDLTLAGRDLVVFSGYSGPDPEVTGLAPPHPRTLVSRLTLRF